MLESLLESVFPRRSYEPSCRSVSDMATDTLITELEDQIYEFEDLATKREQQRRRENNIPDYSWLVSDPPKRYKLTHMVKVDLEELISKVSAEQTTYIIKDFRESVKNACAIDEIIGYFKDTLVKYSDRHSCNGTLNTKSIGKSSLSEHFVFLRPVRVGDEKPTNRALSAPVSGLRSTKSNRIYPVHVIDIRDDELSEKTRSQSVPIVSEACGQYFRGRYP